MQVGGNDEPALGPQAGGEGLVRQAGERPVAHDLLLLVHQVEAEVRRREQGAVLDLAPVRGRVGAGGDHGDLEPGAVDGGALLGRVGVARPALGVRRRLVEEEDALPLAALDRGLGGVDEARAGEDDPVQQALAHADEVHQVDDGEVPLEILLLVDGRHQVAAEQEGLRVRAEVERDAREAHLPRRDGGHARPGEGQDRRGGRVGGLVHRRLDDGPHGPHVVLRHVGDGDVQPGEAAPLGPLEEAHVLAGLGVRGDHERGALGLERLARLLAGLRLVLAEPRQHSGGLARVGVEEAAVARVEGHGGDARVEGPLDRRPEVGPARDLFGGQSRPRSR